MEERRATVVVRSVLWKLGERWGVLGVQFLLQLFLARLLTPHDYGLVALVWVVLSLAGILVQSGLSTSLIQSKSPNSLDYSSVFYANLAVALVLYVVVFAAAPILAEGLGSTELVALFRVAGLTLFVGAYNSVQNAVVAQGLRFKAAFVANALASIVSGVTALILALSGFGVWAIVGQQLLSAILGCIFLAMGVRWAPSLSFSWKRLKALFQFGWKVLLGAMIDTAYAQARNLMVGIYFGSAALGFFTRGNQLAAFAVDNVNASVRAVMLPAFAYNQDDVARMRSGVRRATVTSAFIVFPLMALMAALADSVILVLLTEKWAAAAPFLQIFAIMYALSPVTTVLLQSVYAIGRSDVTLIWELVTKVSGVGLLLATLKLGVEAIALGALIAGFWSLFLIQVVVSHLLGYRLRDQVKDLLPSILLSVGVGSASSIVESLLVSPVCVLLVGGLGGLLVYVGLAALFRVEALMHLMSTIRRASVRERA